MIFLVSIVIKVHLHRKPSCMFDVSTHVRGVSWCRCLTILVPIPLIWTRTWSSMCLQMSWHLTVPGHQQAQWWPHYRLCRSFSRYRCFHAAIWWPRWRHSKWPPRSRDPSLVNSRSYASIPISSLHVDKAVALWVCEQDWTWNGSVCPCQACADYGSRSLETL